MLDYDRHIGLDDAGKISSRRDFFRLAQVVKADVLGAPCGHCNRIRAGRFPIRKENGDNDVSILIRSVEQADGFVAGKCGFGTVTPAGNVALRYRPEPNRDSSAASSFVCAERLA